MKKLFWKLIILLAAIGIANVYQTEKTLQTLENGIIRLHITANSDSLADQTQKLMIRDAVLAQADFWDTADDCCKALERELPKIERIAEETLAKTGSSASVKAELTKEEFPARQYGTVTLPAGTYRALRITVGEGIGQNWWCVMYPGLCLPAASEQKVIAERFDEDAVSLTTAPEQYEIRLKFVDLLRALWKHIKPIFGNS